MLTWHARWIVSWNVPKSPTERVWKGKVKFGTWQDELSFRPAVFITFLQTNQICDDKFKASYCARGNISRVSLHPS